MDRQVLPIIAATHVHDIVENMHATYITMIADSFRYTSMIHIVQINMHYRAQYLVPKEMPSLFSPHYFCLPCYAGSSDASLCLFILPAAFSSFAV